jgi:hypothetical protein
MSILGFEIVAPDRAFAWCDTEVFAGMAPGEPCGHGQKMAANPLAASVLTGTGRMGPFRDAADAFGACLTFDEALRKLPAAMRLGARSYTADEISARAPLVGQLFGMVGFSHSRGSIVGATFDLADDFEPVVPRRRWRSPAGDGHSHVVDLHSAISLAAQQLDELRQELVAASGGALIFAEITPAEIRCGPVFDFISGCLLTRPPLLTLPSGSPPQGGEGKNTERQRVVGSDRGWLPSREEAA